MVSGPVSHQVQQIARAYLMGDIKLNTYLKEDPVGARKLYADLHLAFHAQLGISRAERILFLQRLFDRGDITSFRDMTFAEARALISFRSELKELYDRSL